MGGLIVALHQWSEACTFPCAGASFVHSVWRRVYPPSDSRLPSPGPGRRWHPALAVPAVVVATLIIPPLGVALAFMARWDRAGRAVTVVLASVWFGVLLVAGAEPKPAHVDAKPQPQSQPVVVVTVTAPAPAAPAPVSASASATAPSPARAQESPAPAAPEGAAPGAVRQPQGEPTAERGRQPVAVDGKARTSDSAPAAGASSSGTSAGGSRSSGSGGGSSVSYRNCTAVRQAGAAPIRRGDPGFGPHLDRDGDGIACE
ncbi:excalibur calcium-binding domain-containing protein [Streptomyces sp. NBC_00211]|uniref:excalibur calcium-binding domain-containing protein n=2 Tax=unclassified Streptomyces TaxID=2593676 RepID=UPI0038645A1F